MLPGWLRQVDVALRELSQRVTLLGAATPTNAREERLRLQGFAQSKKDAIPAWHYVPRDMAGVCRALDAIATELHREGGPLAALYEARVEELLLEARICEHVGTGEASPLAARRFASFHAKTACAADALAETWRSARGEDTDARFIATDDPHPESLLSLLRAEIGRRRIPFQVLVHPHLSALAATGHQTVLVAAGRPISAEATRRTVMHEIEGHVLPRVRATRAPFALFAIGTARSADEQEGYALVLEDRHQFLTASRRRELASRYLAVRTMREGAAFTEVVRRLMADGRTPPHEAVVMAERAFRGSDGTFPGLGRERVYVESYVRVRARLNDAHEDEAVLASGQLGLDAVAVLRPYVSL